MFTNLDEHSYAGKTGEIIPKPTPEKNVPSGGLLFKKIINPMNADKSECFRSFEDFKKLYYSFQCEVCNFISVNKVSMQWHVYAHMLNRPPASIRNEKPFNCITCNKRFNTESNLKKHIREHRFEQGQQKRYYCSKCEECFPSLKIAEEHRLIHHKSVISKCDLCNRRFYSNETLHRHITLHVVEKPFKCNKCTKAYRCRKKWKLHNKLHFQEARFKCSICKKSFVTFRDFNSHLKGHPDGDRTCHICCKKFSDRKSLRLHLLTHSGKSPFCCDVCDKTYVYESSLMKHKKSHSGKCQFQCDICQMGFSSGTVFKQHIEHVHSAENALHTDGGSVAVDDKPSGRGIGPVPTSLLFKLPTSSESSYATLTALPEHGPPESDDSPAPTSLPAKLPSPLEHGPVSSESTPLLSSLLPKLPTSSESSYPALTALRALLELSVEEREKSLEHISIDSENFPAPTSEQLNLPSPSELSSAILIMPAFYD